MPRVLSTKILEANQKELLLNAGLSFVEYDAIKTELNELPRLEAKNAIITSKNAVKAVLASSVKIENCFCVGPKTEAFLKKHKFKVLETADYAADLAKIIIEKCPGEDFTFFCGNKRREELPSILKENHISFKEIEAYHTSLNPQEFPQEFDGVMFFSPSAVQSFVQKNTLKGSLVFCIGDTTAAEARKHTQNIIIANKPGIENVIAKVVSHFSKTHKE